MTTAGEPPSSQSSPLIELPDPEMLPEMDDEEVVVVVVVVVVDPLDPVPPPEVPLLPLPPLVVEPPVVVVVVLVVVVDPLDPVPLLPLPPPPEPPPEPPLGVAQILKPVSVDAPSVLQVKSLVPGAPGPETVTALPDRLPQYFVPSEVCK